MKIALVGTGMIGRAWAVSFARAGHEVTLYNRTALNAEKAREMILGVLPRLAESGLLNGRDADDVASSIRIAEDLAEALEGASYVQESVAESVQIKRDVYSDIEAHAPDTAILASSTSAILPSLFTGHLAHRNRCLVVHPLNPPYVIPAVDVVPSPWTSPEVMDRTCEIMRAIGQAPIRMEKEDPGFLTIRLQGAIYHEAFRLVSEGLASPEAVDTCLRDGLGLRWSFIGPFETADLNAPGGIRDFVGRYGESYREFYPQGGPFPWTGALLDRVEAARRERLPMDEHPARQAWRDRRLVALISHKREQDRRDAEAATGETGR
jgi:3-hydroxyacyl-CoA dehydrogenase